MVTKLVRELKSAVNFFFKAFYRERLELFLHCFDKIPKKTLSNTPEVSFTRTTATILHNNTIQKKKTCHIWRICCIVPRPVWLIVSFFNRPDEAWEECDLACSCLRYVTAKQLHWECHFTLLKRFFFLFRFPVLQKYFIVSLMKCFPNLPLLARLAWYFPGFWDRQMVTWNRILLWSWECVKVEPSWSYRLMFGSYSG